MLEAMEQGAHDDLVFTDRDGGKIKRVSFSFYRAVDELKLNEGISDPRQKVVYHTLRHTFASWLVESGESLYTVSRLLGHSSLEMAARYSHIGESTLQNARQEARKRYGESQKPKQRPVPTIMW